MEPKCSPHYCCFSYGRKQFDLTAIMSLRGVRRLKGQALWLDFLGIQRFWRPPPPPPPQVSECSVVMHPLSSVFPLVDPLVMQALVSGCGLCSGLGMSQKAQGGLLLEDCWVAYMAVQHFPPPFLWSNVKCLAAPPHIMHTLSAAVLNTVELMVMCL